MMSKAGETFKGRLLQAIDVWVEDSLGLATRPFFARWRCFETEKTLKNCSDARYIGAVVYIGSTEVPTTSVVSLDERCSSYYPWPVHDRYG